MLFMLGFFSYDFLHESILTFMFLPCRYCTDDMLQREMMSSPFLGSYGVIILDDIHERSIATDVLLGLLKDVLLARPELKLIINSSPHLIDLLFYLKRHKQLYNPPQHFPSSSVGLFDFIQSQTHLRRKLCFNE